MRVLIFTILGAIGLGGTVLFCEPVRNKAEVVLFNRVSQTEENCPEDLNRPLSSAADGTRQAVDGLLGKCIGSDAGPAADEHAEAVQ